MGRALLSIRQRREEHKGTVTATQAEEFRHALQQDHIVLLLGVEGFDL